MAIIGDFNYIPRVAWVTDIQRREMKIFLKGLVYLRKKIKADKAEEWMVERFETILAMWSTEHTGGRRKRELPISD